MRDVYAAIITFSSSPPKGEARKGVSPFFIFYRFGGIFPPRIDHFRKVQAIFSVVGSVITPFSVMMAVMFAAGVTSNAGL